jgi:hypothetical protein
MLNTIFFSLKTVTQLGSWSRDQNPVIALSTSLQAQASKPRPHAASKPQKSQDLLAQDHD